MIPTASSPSNLCFASDVPSLVILSEGVSPEFNESSFALVVGLFGSLAGVPELVPVLDLSSADFCWEAFFVLGVIAALGVTASGDVDPSGYIHSEES